MHEYVNRLVQGLSVYHFRLRNNSLAPKLLFFVSWAALIALS